jgi:hypothetical protein
MVKPLLTPFLSFAKCSISDTSGRSAARHRYILTIRETTENQGNLEYNIVMEQQNQLNGLLGNKSKVLTDSMLVSQIVDSEGFFVGMKVCNSMGVIAGVTVGCADGLAVGVTVGDPVGGVTGAVCDRGSCDMSECDWSSCERGG